MPIPSRRNTSNNIGGKIFGKEMDELKRLKRERLKAILEFARDEQYTTQEALCDWLYAHGCGCNQGQLSKDLAELGLTPYIDRSGTKRLGRKNSILNDQLEERYVKAFQEAVLNVTHLHKDIILNTLPGFAQAAATVVESASWPEVLSVTYGLSTVTIQCVSLDACEAIYDHIREGVLC